MFKYLKYSYFIVFLIVLSASSFSYAQEVSEAQEEVTEETVPEELPQSEAAPEMVQKNINMKAGPKLKELEEYTAILLNGLEPAQAQYIYNIRQQFGMIRSVQVIRTDVENAVESCSAENPDLKSKMTERFESWNDVIVPKLAVADVALKDAIQRQTFRPTVRLSMLLDYVQEAFEERDAQIKKVPVTTAEACGSLLESMDETEGNLKELIEGVIVDLNELSADPDQTAAVE